MTETNIRRLVIVTRQPRALEVRRTYASANLARFALREREEDYSSYASEEELLLQGLETVKSAIYELGHILEIDRSLLPTTRFHQDDIFVAVGQDGLVANILRYAGELPVIGINPDPARYEGTLLPFEPSDAAQAVLGTIDASLPVQRVTLAEGLFSSGIRILAANDIYIGKFDHSSALYRIQLSSRTERQSSSGILISTPMGATAWERSIVTGAAAVVRAITGRQLAITVKPPPRDAGRLSFWVREPWPSVASSANFVAGTVRVENPLTIISEMGSGGVVFADGMQQDSFPFPAGERLVIKPASVTGRLILPPTRNKEQQ